MQKTVQSNSKIRWRYWLSLSNGQLFEQHEDAQGDLLTLGSGAIHPNLEALLPGLRLHEKTHFVVGAEQAFGYRDAEAIQTLALTTFDSTEPPQVGQLISFSLPSGQEVPGHVLAIEDSQVTVDFNHPLAGQNIMLAVEIMEILD